MIFSPLYAVSIFGARIELFSEYPNQIFALMRKPPIILPAIYYIVNVHRLVLALILNQIPFFYEHSE